MMKPKEYEFTCQLCGEPCDELFMLGGRYCLSDRIVDIQTYNAEVCIDCVMLGRNMIESLFYNVIEQE